MIWKRLFKENHVFIEEEGNTFDKVIMVRNYMVLM